MNLGQKICRWDKKNVCRHLEMEISSAIPASSVEILILQFSWIWLKV